MGGVLDFEKDPADPPTEAGKRIAAGAPHECRGQLTRIS